MYQLGLEAPLKTRLSVHVLILGRYPIKALTLLAHSLGMLDEHASCIFIINTLF